MFNITGITRRCQRPSRLTKTTPRKGAMNPRKNPIFVILTQPSRDRSDRAITEVTMPTSTIMPSPPVDDGMTTQRTLQGPLQGTSATDLAVANTRPRQTARPANPFRNMLSGGVDLLVRGAAVATSVVAGPSMAAAVRDVGAGASAAVAGSTAGNRPGLYTTTASSS